MVTGFARIDGTTVGIVVNQPLALLADGWCRVQSSSREGTSRMSQVGGAASATAKVGRNDPCPCGSGRKFKHCCGGKDARSGPPAGTTPGSSAAARQRQQELLLAAKNLCDAGKWADAIPLLREGVRLLPNDAEAHFNLGAAYFNCNRLPEAEPCLQRALELRPSFEEALKALAVMLKSEGRIFEASRAFRKLSRTAGDPVDRRHWLAGALDLEGKQGEAEKEYRRLLAMAPQRAETRKQLGHLLSNRGMFDEAAQQLTLAIEGLPDVFHQLTAAKRMTESDRPLIDRMRAIAGGPDLAHIPRIGVHFGLARLSTISGTIRRRSGTMMPQTNSGRR
jgi:tetratricopeptide (TPR) repeat protein